MPYLTCSSCGSRTYIVSEGTCPSCGTALRRTSPPAGPRQRRGRADPRQAVDGDAASCAPTPRCSPRSATGASTSAGAGRGQYAGRSVPLSRDDLRAAAERPDRVRSSSDVRSEPALHGVQAGDVRAYIGVPFTTADARAYVLCCLAHEVRPDLGDGRRALPAGHRREPAAGADVRRLGRSQRWLSPVAAAAAARDVRAPRPARGAAAEGRGRSTRRCTSPRRRGTRARVFVVEQGGTIRVLKGGKKSRRSWTSRPASPSGGEQGLLSMAFAPDYATSGLFYVYYTDKNGDEQVVEYKRVRRRRGRPGVGAPGAADPATTRATTTAASCSSGPTSCSTSARATAAAAATSTARTATARTSSSLLGKILRIDPKATAAAVHDPATTRSSSARARGEIYAYGLRNPWRFSFDRTTGDLWIGDVGQGEWEEIDFVRKGKGKGANFGWRVFEGNARYAPGESAPGRTSSR